MIQQAAARAVDIGLTAVAHRLDHLTPVAHQRVQLMKHAAASEPVAGLAQVVRSRIIAILPDAPLIEYLDQNILADSK